MMVEEVVLVVMAIEDRAGSKTRRDAPTRLLCSGTWESFGTPCRPGPLFPNNSEDRRTLFCYPHRLPLSISIRSKTGEHSADVHCNTTTRTGWFIM